MDKKEFQKAEVEVITFDRNDDIVTASAGQQIIGPVTIQPITEIDNP